MITTDTVFHLPLNVRSKELLSFYCRQTNRADSKSIESGLLQRARMLILSISIIQGNLPEHGPPRWRDVPGRLFNDALCGP